MVNREPVGEPYMYRGYLVTATFIGPDLLGHIDGEEMPNFYVNLAAVRRMAERSVDLKIKEHEEKKGERRHSSR